LAGEGHRWDMLILAGRGHHWGLVCVTRVPRQRSANAPRDAAGACPSDLPRPYSDPTLAIYLIFCMGDIIKLKIYSGRGEVRQQDAVLGEPRQRSATLRAARPYAKFADLTLLLGGLDEKSTNRLRYDPLEFSFWPSPSNLGLSRKKVLGSISRYKVAIFATSEEFAKVVNFEKSWRVNQKSQAAELLRT